MAFALQMRGFQRMSFSPRYLIAVNLMLLALAAYSASSIVGTALAAKLIPPPEVVLKPPPPPIEPDSVKPSSHYALIHTRDIFNSAKPEVAPPPAQVAAITPLKLKLWGVALYENGHSYSIIEDLGARKQGVYGVDDEVPGGATVKGIEWDKVVLLHGGKDEILALEKGTALPGAPVAAAAPAGQPAGGSIQATGENEFTVDRREVDAALENMSQLFTQIRAVPHFEGGQSVGFRLFAIRRGSLFDRIGLKNGDIIRSINGSEMNDPSKAVALLQELRNAGNLEVGIIRNQQQQDIRYTIQ
jgi:general secretion pathway protein C